MSLCYPVGESGEVIHFADLVLAHFARFRQTRVWRKEAGGQLFASINGSKIVICEATGPRSTDRRGRVFYEPDRASEQSEIEDMFSRGLHYVGDWHTHPEQFPKPSRQDMTTMESRVKLSRHHFAGFIFVIVGKSPPPDGLAVIIHDGENEHLLDIGECELPAGSF